MGEQKNIESQKKYFLIKLTLITIAVFCSAWLAHLFKALRDPFGIALAPLGMIFGWLILFLLMSYLVRKWTGRVSGHSRLWILLAILIGGPVLESETKQSLEPSAQWIADAVRENIGDDWQLLFRKHPVVFNLVTKAREGEVFYTKRWSDYKLSQSINVTLSSEPIEGYKYRHLFYNIDNKSGVAIKSLVVEIKGLGRYKTILADIIPPRSQGKSYNWNSTWRNSDSPKSKEFADIINNNKGLEHYEATVVRAETVEFNRNAALEKDLDTWFAE